MKAKTSITLSKDVLKAVDRLAGRNGSRSAVIERAVRDFIAARERRLRYDSEIAKLNKLAADPEFQREHAESLEDQVDL